jgi:hypothetical protein
LLLPLAFARRAADPAYPFPGNHECGLDDSSSRNHGLVFRARGVKFHSLTEAIDTATPTGRAMWQMIEVLAELERSLISERTRAGVKSAQRRGVKFGRKPRLTPEQINHARKLIDKVEARQYVADLLTWDARRSTGL